MGISAEKRRKIAETVNKNVMYLLTISNKRKSDVADYLCMSRATAYRKFADPQRWTLEELISLANYFNVSLPHLMLEPMWQMPRAPSIKTPHV